MREPDSEELAAGNATETRTPEDGPYSVPSGDPIAIGNADSRSGGRRAGRGHYAPSGASNVTIVRSRSR